MEEEEEDEDDDEAASGSKFMKRQLPSECGEGSSPSLPRVTGSPPGGAPGSMLTTSSAQYFSPDPLKSPAFHIATRSLATSCVVTSVSCPDWSDPAPASL